MTIPTPRPRTQPHPATWLLAALLLDGCALAGGPAAPPLSPGESSTGWTEVGVASWYGQPFHGRATASGEIYDMEAPTGAHRTLPFGTRLRVENLENGRATTLTINDRGPFVKGRILDVSRRVAEELGMLGPGTARVRITVMEQTTMSQPTHLEPRQ
jgi:rare lipoprotein A